MIFNLGDLKATVDESCFVAPNSTLIGDVELAKNANVWFNAVLRADNEKISVGEDTNVQEGAVLHVDPGYPLDIGKGVTIGHQATVHGCTVGDYSLIGINSVVLNGAKIGKHCLIGANALVPENMEVPDGSLVVGSPAKIIRELNDKQREGLERSADDYVNRAERYKAELREA